MATPPPVLPPYPVRADGQAVFSVKAEDWNAAMKDVVVPYFYTAASEAEGFKVSAETAAMRAEVVGAVFNSTIAGILGLGTQILIDPRDSGPVYQDAAQTVPGAFGSPVGSIGRVVRATQGTASLKPLWQANYLQHDFVDDFLAYPSAGMPACQHIYATPSGWMRTETRQAIGSQTRVPGGLLRLYAAVAGGLTTDQVTALNTYLGTTEYAFVGMTTDSTVFHRIDGPSGPYTIRYVGANGVVYDQAANNVTTDLAAQGLTSPFTMMIPLAVKSHSNVTYFHCGTNQLTGSIPSLSANTALTYFYCYSNQLTGSIPSLSANTALTNFDCGTNQLTGSIPSLSANTALTYFYCYSNQLTGSIPSLSANTALTNFDCGDNQLTGSIPSLSANTALTYFHCGTNQLTGSIPSLSANTALTNFYCGTNQLTGWVGGSVSATLGDFRAENNLLPASTINAILAAFVAANRTTGTRILRLDGTGNAAPTGQGITDKATLISRGWTVTTN